MWDGRAVVQLGGGHASRPTLTPGPGRRSEESGTLPDSRAKEHND
ncbi:hypothetical protein SEA_LILMAC1015_16 [Arthrobacter phage Lilmac1015]|uniref:Uncharacterized protein n=1 Tax=Arthrobacter phage Lilmac1015 TaxID=2912653 RepID=A0AA49GZW6_9CAUD|nr:hypothetical protein SEA_LILMAC1015_16 [Arthrobacter phage Lilmac1015]